MLTLNVRGLRSNVKRKSLFRYLRSNKFDIVCLQETHVTDDVNKQWKKEWGGEILYMYHEWTKHPKRIGDN